MAAALQCCRFVPSPALPAASSPSRRSPSIVAAPGRREHLCFFPGLKLQQGSTAAALRRRVVVRAQDGARHTRQTHRQPTGQHFVEERKHVMRRYADIMDIDHGCLYVEATTMSAQVCLSANKALKIASRVMDAAYLNNLDAAAPNDISTSTVYRTILDYVDTFLDTADASYNKMMNKETIMSFLGALRALASISHILLEAALEALARTHPRETLSEYAFNCDVTTMCPEFYQCMNDLEDGIMKASAVEICKLVVPVIHEGVKITESFVKLLVARRQRALGKANIKVVV